MLLVESHLTRRLFGRMVQRSAQVSLAPGWPGLREPGNRSRAKRGTEGCLTKLDGKAATSSGGSHWHSLDSVPSPGPGQRKYLCAGIHQGVYSVGLLGAKTEIPVKMTRRRLSGSGKALSPRNHCNAPRLSARVESSEFAS